MSKRPISAKRPGGRLWSSTKTREFRLQGSVILSSSYDFIVENSDLNEAVYQVKAIIIASRSNRDMRLYEKMISKRL